MRSTSTGKENCSAFTTIKFTRSADMAYLMTVEELTFLDEIDCRDLFSGDNPRERIVIFEF